MTEDEAAFLKYVGLGWFTVDQLGKVWRHYGRRGQRWGGAEVVKARRRPTRAERSKSCKGGYLRVMFADGAKRRRVAAHRIVWMMFHHRDIPAGLEINHKDGNKQNNAPSNLEMVTRSQNTRHAVRVLDKIIRPRATPGAKLTRQQVIEIRDLWNRKAMTQPELATHYGMSVISIQGIIYRRTWKHIP